jgi:hypothetical protein
MDSPCGDGETLGWGDEPRLLRVESREVSEKKGVRFVSRSVWGEKLAGPEGSMGSCGAMQVAPPLSTANCDNDIWGITGKDKGARAGKLSEKQCSLVVNGDEKSKNPS